MTTSSASDNLFFSDRRLIDAILSGNADAVEKALDDGAKANGVANDGRPLLEAARKENLYIAALLQAAGADIDKTRQLSRDKQRELAVISPGDNADIGNVWVEMSSYQTPVDWLHDHRQEISLMAISITGRQLVQKVSNLERRFTDLEQTVDKAVNPAAIEKSKLSAPKTP